MSSGPVGGGQGDSPAAAAAGLLARRRLDPRAAPRVIPAARGLAPPASDSPEKFVVVDGRGSKIAFAYASTASAPDAVARNVERIAAARAALGEGLGGAVLAPIAAGEEAGLSAAIFPLCTPLATNRIAWRLQRPLVRRWGLRWLKDVVRRTSRPASEEEIGDGFAAPLAHLARMAGVAPAVRARALHALDRLRLGRWRPRHALMHGDFWKGNLVIRRNGRTARGAVPLPASIAVVDWGTAEVSGYALFDLVRFADSLALRPALLRREVARHCRILGCDPADGASHLLAALGFRALNLDRFPPERFAAMAARCVQVIDAAMPEGPPRAEVKEAGEGASADLQGS